MGNIRLEAPVVPCVLYACGTWTLTAESERRLRSFCRRMLRWMVRLRKHPEEDLTDYIKRATHTSEDLAEKFGSKDWVSLQRSKKWSLAGRTAAQTDGRWNQRLLSWRPWCRCFPHRRVGRPAKRWEDDIVECAGGGWVDVAKCPSFWSALSHGFVIAVSKSSSLDSRMEGHV